MKTSAHLFSTLLALLLSACAAPSSKRPDPNEPHGSAMARELKEHPDSQFSRAFRGEPDALHATFRRVLNPQLDGGASESFGFEVMAIRGSIGDDRFFDALSHESAVVQQGMERYAPR